MPFKNRAALSPLEARVLRYYVLGYTYKQVAAFAGTTGHNRVNNLIKGVRLKYAERGRPSPTREQLRERAIEDGLIRPDEWAAPLKGSQTMNVTLVSSKNCGRCRAAAASMERNNIAYDYVLIEDDPTEHAAALALGYQSAPVTIVRDSQGNVLEHWGDYDLARIRALSTTLLRALQSEGVVA